MNDGFLILLIVFIVMSGINEIDKRHVTHQVEISKAQTECVDKAALKRLEEE